MRRKEGQGGRRDEEEGGTRTKDERGGRREGREGRRVEEREKLKNEKVARGRIIGLAGPCCKCNSRKNVTWSAVPYAVQVSLMLVIQLAK